MAHGNVSMILGATLNPTLGASLIGLLLLLAFAFHKFSKARLPGGAIWAQNLEETSTPDVKAVNACQVDFKGQFPPSRRECIFSSTDEKTLNVRRCLKGASPTPGHLQSWQLPSTKAQPHGEIVLFTPTGFSTDDITALGKIPDYSVLSGVPHPKPCPNFDINKAVFRPFRPFRFGYHQTMALMKFEPDYWIELEKNYFQRLEQRKRLLQEHGTTILNYNPGSELACRELMEIVLQNVSIRYPQYFSLEESNTVLVNRLLGSRTHLNSAHPLNILFDNIPEDFAIMLRSEEDGMYYLRAGFICSSIGWTFGTHNNRQLRAIHTEVNDYEEKMAKSMDRYFSKMPTDQPIQRGSWFVEDWQPLFVPPEEYAQNAGTRHQGEKVSIDQCYLRCDWQTLRRLPLSGGVVFNFKAVFTPMTELRNEPFIPSLLYKQITASKPLLTDSKVHAHIRPVVLEALQGWKQEQIEQGLIPPDWEESTLSESPFYPGWEERWRKRIGFEI